MAFLLGDWFKEEEDDVNELPHDLRDIYINPWKVRMSRDGHLLGTCCTTAGVTGHDSSLAVDV